MNDSQLLHLYLTEHSQAAFRELVNRYSALVYGTALRRLGGDSHLAQDAAQRVFLALFRKASSLQGRENLAGWLHSAARREAAHLVRSDVRRKRREEESNAMSHSVEEEVSWDRLVPLIDQAVEELEARDRDPVLLRFFSGKSYSEIGEALGTTEESARKRVERAIDKLRERLRRRGVLSSSSALALVLEGNAATTVTPSVQASIASAVWAQAATGTTSSLGVFMAANKLLVGFAAIALALGATAVVRDVLAYRDTLRLSQGDAIAEESAVRANRRLQAEAEGLRKEAVAAKAAKPSPAPALQDILSSEAFQKANLRWALLSARLESRWIAQKLHLSPDKAEQLAALLAEQRQAKLEAEILQAKGGDPQSIYRQVGPLTWQGIDSLLGTEASKAFSDYMRSASVYRFVDQISTALPISEPPLTEDEVDQLVAIALANDGHYQSGKGTDTSQVDWDAVWAPASSVVDETKLSVLKLMVENQTLSRTINARIQKIGAGK